IIQLFPPSTHLLPPPRPIPSTPLSPNPPPHAPSPQPQHPPPQIPHLIPGHLAHPLHHRLLPDGKVLVPNRRVPQGRALRRAFFQGEPRDAHAGWVCGEDLRRGRQGGEELVEEGPVGVCPGGVWLDFGE